MQRTFATLTPRPHCLAQHRRGAASLEFALVAVPFLTLLLGVMEVGYDLFAQAALDYAVVTAARSVQVGSTTGVSGESSATLAAAAVCPAVKGLLPCSDIIVGVAPLATGTDFYNDASAPSITKAASAAGNVCTGLPGQMMVLTAWYTGPTLLGGLIPSFSTTYNGALVHITSSSAGFVNELFNGGQSSGSGC